ncbi:MAG: uroporphyrinogen decarboxylase family protein [Nevskia sp.]|nr:uroporphyrinogen decarboxylase family protein [Nevskia sp.]MDR3670557.1 uroporphyrinogen decarboxylase family protein [Holophaga sp.]
MQKSTMTHWERIEAAVAGQALDRVPVSLWRHFPVIDLDPVKLAEASIHWQKTYDFDLVKFMSRGTYSVEDWGAVSAYHDSPIGTRVIAKPGLTSADAWPRLAKLNPNEGVLGGEVKALSLTAEALKGEVPILFTLFNPLTTAYKLAGDRLFADLRRHPDLVEAGLAIIAQTTIDFARACLKAGAHGLFYSTQMATYRLLNEAEHLRFGAHYDRLVLDALAGEAKFTMLHLHGNDVIFNQALDYPANMVNWHDRHTELNLAAAMSRFPGLLAGGIDQDALPTSSIAAIKAQVRDAIAQTKGRRLLIAPGCVVPIATPDAHYRAVLEAAAE